MQHVTCLRGKLDSTPYVLTVPKGKRGLGKYGCGNKNRITRGSGEAIGHEIFSDVFMVCTLDDTLNKVC